MKQITRLFLLAVVLTAGSASLYAQPSTAAPTPPALESSRVVSIFSNAFTNVTGTDFFPNWGQSTVVTTEDIAGNETLKYANLNYQGTQFTGSVNALPMKKLHLDLWTSDGTAFQITPVSPGPKEFLVSRTPVQNQWNSFDFDLTEFTGLDLSEIIQLKIVGNGTVYLDNIYFYDNTSTVDSEAPTAFSASVGIVASDAVELLLTASDNSGSVNYTITYGESATEVSTSGVSGVQKSYTINGLTPSTAYSFSIVAKDPAGNVAANNPQTVNATTLASIPASPVPSQDASKVISIFSDAYENVANTNFYPGWGQSTVAAEAILGGNKAMKYTSFNYQGIELGSHVDASAMLYLHVDIYPTTETAIRLTPISPGLEIPTSLGDLNLNEWNVLDIPLSTYSVVNFTDVFQFKFDGGTGKTFYMDNLYFHSGVPTDVTATVELDDVTFNYTMASKSVSVKASSLLKQASVYNLMGVEMLTVDLKGNEGLIYLSSLPKAGYIVKVTLQNGESKVSKLVRL